MSLMHSSNSVLRFTITIPFTRTLKLWSGYMCFVCVISRVLQLCTSCACWCALSLSLWQSLNTPYKCVLFLSSSLFCRCCCCFFFLLYFFASNSRTYKHSKRIVLQWVFRDMRSKCPKFVSSELGKMFANLNQWHFANLWFKSLDMNTKY